MYFVISVELTRGKSFSENHKHTSMIISHFLILLMEAYCALICCLLASRVNLNENVPHRLSYSNICFPVGGAVQRDDIGLLGAGFESSQPCPFTSLLCFMVLAEDVIQLLLVTCCHTSLPW